MVTIEVTIIETGEDVEIELEREDNDSNDNGDSFVWVGEIEDVDDSQVRILQLRGESFVSEENIEHGDNIKVNKKRIISLIDKYIDKLNEPEED